MAVEKQQPCRTKASKKKNTTSTRKNGNNHKPPKPPVNGVGRKRIETNNQQPMPADQPKLKPGEGGTKLLSAFNHRVARESERIALAVVNKAIGGDMNGARLLANLTGATAQSSQLTKKSHHRPLSFSADGFGAQPEWHVSSDPEVDTGFGGRETEN